MPRDLRQAALFFGSMILCNAVVAAPPDGLSARILASTLATNYQLAERQADSLIDSESTQSCFYQAMVQLSRFDDLGDTLSLGRAKKRLESCNPKETLWEALRLFQLGYVQAESGSSVSAALTTRKAAQSFLTHGTLEARGFHAIYAYYMEGATAWVPFRKDDRSAFLQTLDSARLQSDRFWPLFTTSEVWILFDRHDYQKALAVVEWALARSPKHPVYFQMKGDMLYRLKRFGEAAKIYEQSFQDYSLRAPQGVRWWSAAGNLLRIYAALGDKARVAHWQSKFKDPSFKLVEERMPASLMDALQDANLLPE